MFFEHFLPQGSIFWATVKYIYIFAPIWAPILLFRVFIDQWLKYIRTRYILEQGNVLLEIKLPKEISKSPAAMEVFLTSLYQTGGGSHVEYYWEGKVRPWFSLELVSIEGQVKFYIWTPPKYKNVIEAQIYAQYPSVEIYEVPDYTLPQRHDPEKYTMWGTNWKLTKSDPYPIKTYVDYGLDKDPKEEYKIDPMTSTLEFLGSLKRGEQVWIQILIQAHKKEGLLEGHLFTKHDWKQEAKKEVEKIKKEYEGDSTERFPRPPTESQKKTIEALDRSIDKYPFECGLRGIYIASNEAFDNGTITGLIGSVRQYDSNDLNGFKLAQFTDHTDETKNWLAIFGWVPGLKKSAQNWRWRLEKRFLEAYKLRSYFHPPYKFIRKKPPKAFVLNTEELATIFHFPGQIATTPTLLKTPSKKMEAPPNIPV